MASWQGGHGQRRSALSSPMDPVGSPRASQAPPQAGRVWVQTPLCRHAAQMPGTRWAETMSTLKGTNSSFDQGLIYVSGCCWGTRQLFPLTIKQKLILRQRATEISSLGSLELGLGTQQLPRGAVCMRSLVQPCRELRDTTLSVWDGCGVTCLLPDACHRP